ncbi:MAG: DUF1592 domain-containing protein [Pirellulaceae bacterium]
MTCENLCHKSRQDLQHCMLATPKVVRTFATIVCVLALLSWNVVYADELTTFVQDSCISCHDADTETNLNLQELGQDLSDPDVFHKWVLIHDRVQRGEMPPSSESRPSEQDRQWALLLLSAKLRSANRSVQLTGGRVPTRRLTRTEYENTLHDLLGIAGDLAKHLPPENESSAFDVVAAEQEMSSVHVRGLLTAADFALDEAIQMGPKPRMAEREIDYFNSPYIQMWVDRSVRRGGGTIFKTDHDVITFRGGNYVFRSDNNGFKPPIAGRYRITVKAAAHQPRSSITVSLKRQNDKQGESELFAAWDLVGEDYREVSTTKYLRPDNYIYVSADELEPAPDGRVIYNAQSASTFQGEGVKIRRVTVAGPLEITWPPERTRTLFAGIEWEPRRESRDDVRYASILTKPPQKHIRDIVAAFAPRAFRREVSDKEIDDLVALANPSLEANRDFVECVRIPLRAILVSPQLLFLGNETIDSDSRHGFPPTNSPRDKNLDRFRNQLSDNAMAARLSYFLWRSLPDEELNQLASEGQLSDPVKLAKQVSRMLNDPRFERFVRDFLDQWLDLDRIDATTPDAYLYPEYDDVLRRAMLAETRDFFAHLIDENLSTDNLIDSDFTFLNRRLAEHYGIDGVEGEATRQVKLPVDSVRGGILTHASIAKVTANGTVTTPVKRGNFVLRNLLGLPTHSPPPGIGSIEPDTRGATTIRDTLEKHQSVETCAVCHRRIDPPGFALECFDPVGNFRTHYRNSKGVKRTASVGLRFLHLDYDLGLPVETSGVDVDGFKFDDIRDYKRHLLESRAQVARNVLSQLITFSTGADVEFADRDEVERILKETQGSGYPLRTLIHQVVGSRLFRNR